MRTPSHPTVVAYGALFLALSGVSYAAISVPKNSIRSAQLAAGSVGEAELQKGAVGAAELKRAAVSSDKIRDGAVRREDLQQRLQQVMGDSNGQAVPGPPGSPGSSGAEGEQGDAGLPDSPADVLAKVKAVSGAGSGLDADQLDGSQAGDLARVVSNARETAVQGFPLQEQLIAVPGFGTLYTVCNAANDWDTSWIPQSGVDAPTYASAAQSGATIVFGPGDDGVLHSAVAANAHTWQVTLPGGGGMTIRVLAHGNAAPNPDVCRFAAVAVYEAP